MNPDFSIRIYNQDNLVHDGLKIDQDWPYSYADIFWRDTLSDNQMNGPWQDLIDKRVGTCIPRQAQTKVASGGVDQEADGCPAEGSKVQIRTKFSHNGSISIVGKPKMSFFCK